MGHARCLSKLEDESEIFSLAQDIVNKNLSVRELEDINKIKYDDVQISAIKKALENNLLVITGGPGTGKTTIIKAIVELYK